MEAGAGKLGSLSITGISQLELGGLELVGADGAELISLDELLIDINPWALIRDRLSINALTVSGLGLDIEVDEDGVNSLTKIFIGDDSADSEQSGLEIVVNEIEVAGATIRYRELASGDDEPVEHMIELGLVAAVHVLDGVTQIPELSGQATIDGNQANFVASIYSSPVETGAQLDLSGLGSRVVGSGSYSPAINGEESWSLSLSEVELDLEALGELAEVPLVGNVVATLAGAQDSGVAAFDGNLLHGTGELTVAAEMSSNSNTLSFVPRGLDLTAISPILTEPLVLSGEVRLNSDSLAGMLSPEIDIDLEDSIIWGLEIPSASLVGSFDGEELIIDELRVVSPITSLSASGVLSDSGAELNMELTDANLRRLNQFGVYGLGGFAAANGHLFVSLEEEGVEVDWDGSVNVSNFSNPSARFSSLTGPLSASMRGGDFTVSGESLVSNLNAGAAAVDLIELQWSVEKAESLEWSSTVSADSLSSGDFLVSWITGRVAGSGDSVHGRLDMTLINGLTQVWPSGTLRFDLRDTFRFTGSILGEANNEISLDLVSDRGFSEFELRELSVGLEDQPSWTTTGSAVIRRGGESLAIRGLELVSDRGGAVRLEATGSNNGPISANLHLAQFPLDWIEPWIDQSGYDGLISGDLSLGGRSDALRVEADLNAVDLNLPDTVTGLDCQLSLRTEGEVFGWSAEIIRGGNSLANLSGSLPIKLSMGGADVDWNGPLSLDGVLAPVSNAHWREGVPALVSLPEGRSSASISLEGTLREPLGEINAGLAWRLGSDNRQFRVDLGLGLEESQVSMVGGGRTGGIHLFDLRGSIGTALSDALASLAGDDVDFPSAAEWVDSFEIGLAPMGVSMDLLRGFAPLPESFEGLVSGSISVVGGASEPRAVIGVSLSDGSFGQAQIPSAVFSLVPTEDHYDLSMFSSVGLGSLIVTGSVPYGGLDTGGLELEIDGPELPLDILTGIVPNMQDVVGNISINGQVRGALSSPEPRVAVSIPRGALNMPNLGVAFSELRVDAVLTESGMDLTRFSGESEKIDEIGGDLFDSNGSFQGSLEYSYEGGLAGGFICDSLSLSETPKKTLRTTGHLSIEGPVDSANVVGEFVVDEGRYILTSSDWLTSSDVALSSSIVLHRAGTELTAVALDEPLFFDGWSMSLGVDLAQNTWVDVSMPLNDTFGSVTSAVSTVGLDGRLDGDLQVDYSPVTVSSNDDTGEVVRSGGLDVVGELLVIRGNTKVFGKDFAVDDGSVRFTGGGLSEPDLDISATHTNREYGDIVVDIAGQPRQMGLAFSSSDGWSDTDMASILLLGRPVSSLTQSEGGAGLNLVGTALGVMAGTASNLVQMSSMVDTIEVESEGESISSLSVGWDLGSDLFVTITKDYTAVAGDNISEITLEWLISKRIQAELSTGDRGQSSADLYMKWRF